ncbi:MAG: hypothetical protein QXT63_03900 [Thermoplasmata archaeon]
MPLDIPMTISGIIGFAPAIILLFIFLKEYDTLFDDRKVFITFGVGMIIGMAITTLHALTDGLLLARIELESILIFLLMYVLLEQFVKSAVLHSKWFVGRYDTTYYGASLGLGIGSMAIIIRAYTALRVGDALTDLGVYAILITLSFVMTLIHASTGAIIGYGSYKKESWKYVGIAMAVFVPYLVISIIYSVSADYLGYGSLIFVVFMLLYSAYIYYWVYSKLLPKTLPEKMRKEILRKRKAIMRRAKRLSELPD